MNLLQRRKLSRLLICKECGSKKIKYLKEDIYQCLNCSSVFRYLLGLGFDKKIFTGYCMNEDYDNFMRTKYLNAFLNLEKNDVFLDAGCGLGFFTLYASGFVKKAVGIDIERWRLRSANESKKKLKIENADFRYANIYNIPYPDNYFDKILCAEVLEHLITPSKAIYELARACRNILIIQVPTVSLLKTIGEKFFGSTIKSKTMTEGQFKSLPHVQRFTPSFIFNLMRLCGFKDINMVGVRLIPLNLITNNKSIIFFEYLLDVNLGTHFPFNRLGTMTIIRGVKK